MADTAVVVAVDGGDEPAAPQGQDDQDVGPPPPPAAEDEEDAPPPDAGDAADQDAQVTVEGDAEEPPPPPSGDAPEEPPPAPPDAKAPRKTVIQPRASMAQEDAYSVFKGREARLMSPQQILKLMDESMYSNESMMRGTRFKPKDGDVMVCSPPQSGVGHVMAMIDVIRTEGAVVDAKGLRKKVKDQVPWIEHRRHDGKAFEDMLDPQEGLFRMFRTTMTAHSLEGRIELHPKTKFIAVLRDPLDLRLSWFRYLQEEYEAETHDPAKKAQFGEIFTADHFALEPIAMLRCSTRKKEDSQDEDYENNVVGWWQLRTHPNVLIVFYEEMLHDAGRFARRIAHFLDVHMSDELQRSVVESVTTDKMKKSYHVHHTFHEGSFEYGQADEAMSVSLYV